MSQLTRTAQGHAPATPRTPSSAPATPLAQNEQEVATPGKWKHPKFDEIARRQHATSFDERNVRAIVINAILLSGSLLANSVISKIALLRILSYVNPYPVGSSSLLTHIAANRSLPCSTSSHTMANIGRCSSLAPSSSTTSFEPSCLLCADTTPTTSPIFLSRPHNARPWA